MAVVASPEQVITQYTPLIAQQARRCKSKLPPGTMWDLEDLIQEGRIHAVQVATKFDAARSAKFMTLLHVALQHRYRRILRKEWKQRGGQYAMSPRKLARYTVPAPQDQQVVLLDLCATARRATRKGRAGFRVKVKDRYRFLRVS